MRRLPLRIGQFSGVAPAGSTSSSGSCPACPFASAGLNRHAAGRSRRERARESCKFTLKGNRAERVQIVNAASEPLITSAPRLYNARPGLLLAEPVGVAGEIFDVNARECHAEFAFGSGHCRQHDFCHKL